MSYDKYTWTTGETITADKLNHLENGVAEGSGGVEIIKLATAVNGGGDSYDKSFGMFGGGGPFDGGKTLGELIGTKSILSIYCTPNNASDEDYINYYPAAKLYVGGMDVILNQNNESVRNASGFTLRAVCNVSTINTVKPDVYAICI